MQNSQDFQFCFDSIFLCHPAPSSNFLIVWNKKKYYLDYKEYRVTEYTLQVDRVSCECV